MWYKVLTIATALAVAWLLYDRFTAKKTTADTSTHPDNTGIDDFDTQVEKLVKEGYSL